MMRISVLPEDLRNMAAQLRRTAGDLREVQQRMGSALGSLDWETRFKVSIDGQVNSACRQADALADQAESIARFLGARANAFDDADRQGVTGLSRIVIPDREILWWYPPRPTWPSWPWQAVLLPVVGSPFLGKWTWPKITFPDLPKWLPPWLQPAKPIEMPSGETDKESPAPTPTPTPTSVQTPGETIPPELQTTPLPSSMKKRMDQLENTYVIESEEYGAQCVTLAKELRKDLGPAPNISAMTYLHDERTIHIGADGTPGPQPGAVLIWGGRKGMPDGHVAIVESVNSNGTVNVIEQNWPLGAPVRRRGPVELDGNMGFIPLPEQNI